MPAQTGAFSLAPGEHAKQESQPGSDRDGRQWVESECLLGLIGGLHRLVLDSVNSLARDATHRRSQILQIGSNGVHLVDRSSVSRPPGLALRVAPAALM